MIQLHVKYHLIIRSQVLGNNIFPDRLSEPQEEALLGFLLGFTHSIAQTCIDANREYAERVETLVNACGVGAVGPEDALDMLAECGDRLNAFPC